MKTLLSVTLAAVLFSASVGFAKAATCTHQASLSRSEQNPRETVVAALDVRKPTPSSSTESARAINETNHQRK